MWGGGVVSAVMLLLLVCQQFHGVCVCGLCGRSVSEGEASEKNKHLHLRSKWLPTTTTTASKYVWVCVLDPSFLNSRHVWRLCEWRRAALRCITHKGGIMACNKRMKGESDDGKLCKYSISTMSMRTRLNVFDTEGKTRYFFALFMPFMQTLNGSTVYDSSKCHMQRQFAKMHMPATRG